MPKLEPATGAPTIHMWSPIPNANLTHQKLRKHPKVRWLCRTFEAEPNKSHVMPDGASSTTGLTTAQSAARRIAEHAAVQVALGASMASMGFFIQNFADFYGVTQEIMRGEDDAVGGGRLPRDNLYSAKARVGPITEPGKVPIETISAEYRDALKLELQGRGLGALGRWIGDTERGPSPWEWCTASSPFGNWGFMVGDARYTTEAVAFGAYAIGGPIADRTLSQLVATVVSRLPSFSPVFNANWSTGANATFAKELLRLRADVWQSAYAKVTVGIWNGDAFWSALKVSNYQMCGNNSAVCGMTFPESGGEDGEWTCGYFGLQQHGPVCYPRVDETGELPVGQLRFNPTPRVGEGRAYDEVAYLNRTRRSLMACHLATGSLETIPWLRGIDLRPSVASYPNPLPVDLAKATRLAATFPRVRDVVWWYDDSPGQPGPGWDDMLEAVEQVYPNIVWSSALNDWEVI
jgi:hypothetical protein